MKLWWFSPETHTKRQATQHGCPTSLLSDGDKGIEIVYVQQRDQREVAPADCCNWGEWGLLEYKWKGSFLLVGCLGLSCRYHRFLLSLGCSSRPRTKYFFSSLNTGDTHSVTGVYARLPTQVVGQWGHINWNSVWWGKNILNRADQSSQGRIKVSSTGTSIPKNQPHLSGLSAIHYFNTFVSIAQQAGRAAVLGRLSLSLCLRWKVYFYSHSGILYTYSQW